MLAPFVDPPNDSLPPFWTPVGPSERDGLEGIGVAGMKRDRKNRVGEAEVVQGTRCVVSAKMVPQICAGFHQHSIRITTSVERGCGLTQATSSPTRWTQSFFSLAVSCSPCEPRRRTRLRSPAARQRRMESRTRSSKLGFPGAWSCWRMLARDMGGRADALRGGGRGAWSTRVVEGCWCRCAGEAALAC